MVLKRENETARPRSPFFTLKMNFCVFFKKPLHFPKTYDIIPLLTSGPLVKRLRHRPFTAKTWVRFPYGSPKKIGTHKECLSFLSSLRSSHPFIVRLQCTMRVRICAAERPTVLAQSGGFVCLVDTDAAVDREQFFIDGTMPKVDTQSPKLMICAVGRAEPGTFPNTGYEDKKGSWYSSGVPRTSPK